MTGCAGLPGKTVSEQVQAGDELIITTLDELIDQNPQVLSEIEHSVGYAIMNNSHVKVPVLGTGSGYGVAVNNLTGEKTYLQMARFDIGGGLGIRNVRPAIIFHKLNAFREFIQGQWTFDIGAEASVKVGNKGSALDGNRTDTADIKVYQLTDEGISVTFTANLTRITPIELETKTTDDSHDEKVPYPPGLTGKQLLAKLKIPVGKARQPLILAESGTKTFMDVFASLPEYQVPSLEPTSGSL